MKHRLSIKGLIVAVFAVILGLALAATASVLITDRLAREALAQHEREVQELRRTLEPGADTPLPRLEASYRRLEEAIALGTRLTLIVRVASFLIGLLLAVLIYRRVAALVGETTEFAGRIEGGDLAARFEVDPGDELAQLAAALNRMTDRLRESLAHEVAYRRRLDFLVSAAPVAIYAARFGGDYGVSFISANVREQVGRSAEEFLGNPALWVENLHPDDRSRVLATMERLPETGRIATEYRFRHADGSWRWMRDEAVLVGGDDGLPDELIGSWSDITPKKTLEESLRCRDAVLAAVAYGSARFLHVGDSSHAEHWQVTVEAVLSHLGEATGVSRIWVAENLGDDPETLSMRIAHRWAQREFAIADDDPLLAARFSYRDEGMGVEALRLRRGELLQLRPADLPGAVRERFVRYGVRSQVRAPVMRGDAWWGFIAFDDCVAERAWTPAELEALQTAANLLGAAIAAHASRVELRASVEKLGSMVEKLKGQRAEIERQNRALADANQGKSAFLAAVTHELRTPLNAIIGFADLLAAGVGGTLPAAQQAYVADILDSGKQLAALVSRLLELARLEAGMTTISPEATDIDDLLAAAIAAARGSAEKRGIAIVLDAGAAPVVAAVDARLLRRLLDELLANAVKFSHDGGRISVAATVCEADATLEIAVADSGIGIAAADLGRLFQPFVQLDGALARHHAGVGIGLLLARRIAELHGGRIEVESTPGEGSRFCVRLPLAPTPPAAENDK